LIAKPDLISSKSILALSARIELVKTYSQPFVTDKLLPSTSFEKIYSFLLLFDHRLSSTYLICTVLQTRSIKIYISGLIFTIKTLRLADTSLGLNFQRITCNSRFFFHFIFFIFKIGLASLSSMSYIRDRRAFHWYVFLEASLEK